MTKPRAKRRKGAAQGARRGVQRHRTVAILAEIDPKSPGSGAIRHFLGWVRGPE
jgi:hypothetical protein